MAGEDPIVELQVRLSPDSVAAIGTAVTQALTKAFKDGLKSGEIQINAFGRTATKATQPVIKLFDEMNQEMKDFGQTTKIVGKDTESLLTGLQQETINLLRTLQKYTDEVRVQAASIAAVRTRTRQADIRATSEFNAQARERVETIRAESKANFIEQQKRLIRERDAGKIRILLVQQALQTITRLEKAAGATIAGIARTTTSAVSRSLTSIGGLFRRNNSALQQGLGGALRGRETLMRSSFSRQERLLRETVTRQTVILQDFNKKISTGALGAATGRGVGGGILGPLAAGAGVGALLSSGLQRFSDLERINKQFLALTGNLETSNALLAEAKEFAKQTPFDLVGVADLAKGFLAIGTAAEDVMPQVKAIADAVALTGGGVDELNRIQRAIGQVVSAGRLQGDELNQLAENLPGLNIRKILADQISGGDVAKLVEMQEAGEISGELFVEGLIAGLAGDPRLAGASEALAKTLSGRIANLKESFADFGAAIIGVFSGPLKLLISGLQTVLQGFADFVKGEGLSEGLTILRDALFGVAAGLAAVIAVKAAVEVFQLLGTALTFALTPFGALIVGASLFGAAIVVLVRRSEALRNTLKVIGDRLGEVAGTIADRFRPAFEQMGDLVNDRIIPAIDLVATFLAENLLGALDRVASFIIVEVLPAFTALTEQVVAFTEKGVNGLTAQLQKVMPFLRPAIDGFTELASAIAAALTGDFSFLGSGVAASIGGVASSLSLIADEILTVLEPIGAAIAAFFSDMFSPENIARYLEGVLELVESIGRILGQIISSPLLLKVVAGIAVAAGVIGFRFAKGFIEGIASNLPELGRLLGDVLSALFKLAISNINLVVVGLLALLVGNSIRGMVGSFRRAGEQAGGGFAGGFKTAMSKVRGGADFLGGLAGNSGAVIGPTTKILDANIAKMAVLRRQLRAFGAADLIPNLGTTQGLKNAQAEVGRLKKGISEARQQGLLLRDTLSQVGASLGTAARGISTGLRQALAGFSTGPKARLFAVDSKGVANEIQGIRGAFQRLFGAVRGGAKAMWNDVGVVGSKIALTNLRTNLEPARALLTGTFLAARREVGRFGQALRDVGEGAKFIGRTMASDFVGPNFRREVTGRIAGVAAAFDVVNAKVSPTLRKIRDGLSQVGTVARFTGDVVRTRLTSAWGSFATAAQAAVDKVKTSAGGRFMSSVAAGITQGAGTVRVAFATSLAGLREAALAAGTTAGAVIGKGIAAGIAGAIAGFTAGKFAGEAGAGSAGIGLAALGTGLATGFALGPVAGVIAGGFTLAGGAIGAANKAAKDFKERLEEIASTVRGPLTDAIKDGELAVIDFKNALSLEGANSLNDEIFALLSPQTKARMAEFGVTVNDLRLAFKGEKLLPSDFAKGGGALKEIQIIMGGIKRTVDELDVDKLVFPERFAPDAEDAADAVGRTVDNFERLVGLGGGTGNFAVFIEGQKALVEANDEATQEALENSKLYTEQLDILFETLKQPFVPGDSPFTALAEQALIGAQGLNRALESAIQDGLPKIGADGVTQVVPTEIDIRVSEARTNEVVREFAASIGSVLAKGIEDNLIVDDTSARALTQGIFDAATEGLDPNSAAFKQISAAFEAALSGITPIIDQINVVGGVKSVHDGIAAYLEANPLSTVVQARFAVFSGSTAGKVSAQRNGPVFATQAGFDSVFGVPDPLSVPVEFDTPSNGQMQSIFIPLGFNAGIGFKLGISASMPSVLGAATQLVTNVSSVLKKGYGIQSPSKVTMGFGEQLGAGLAIGIANSTNLAVEAARVMAAEVAAAADVAASAQVGFDGRINGQTPGAFVAQTGAVAVAPTPTPAQSMPEVDILRLARAIAAETKPTITVDQTFNEKVDSRAVASDLAWRLGT